MRPTCSRRGSRRSHAAAACTAGCWPASRPDLQPAGVRWLVTTADWSNEASTRSFVSLGFEPRARAAELVLGPWRYYRLPAGVPLGGERPSGDSPGDDARANGEVRLVAPPPR